VSGHGLAQFNWGQWGERHSWNRNARVNIKGHAQQLQQDYLSAGLTLLPALRLTKIPGLQKFPVCKNSRSAKIPGLKKIRAGL